MRWPEPIPSIAGFGLDMLRAAGAGLDALVVAAQDVFGGEDDA